MYIVIIINGVIVFQASAASPFPAEVVLGVCVPDSCSAYDLSVLLNIGKLLFARMLMLTCTADLIRFSFALFDLSFDLILIFRLEKPQFF